MHARRADGEVGLSLAPRPAERVGEDHADDRPGEGTDAGGERPGGGIRIDRQQQHRAVRRVGRVDAGRRADDALAVLDDAGDAALVLAGRDDAHRLGGDRRPRGRRPARSRPSDFDTIFEVTTRMSPSSSSAAPAMRAARSSPCCDLGQALDAFDAELHGHPASLGPASILAGRGGVAARIRPWRALRARRSGDQMSEASGTPDPTQPPAAPMAGVAGPAAPVAPAYGPAAPVAAPGGPDGAYGDTRTAPSSRRTRRRRRGAGEAAGHHVGPHPDDRAARGDDRRGAARVVPVVLPRLRGRLVRLGHHVRLRPHRPPACSSP